MAQEGQGNMKKIAIWSFVAIIGLGGIIYAAVSSPNADGDSVLGSSESNEDSTSGVSFTFASVKDDVSAGAKFYDVRTAAEFSTGHFESAENWSLQDIQAGTLPDVSKDSTIYIYCNSGNRSGQAAVILKNAGYSNVIDLGGLSDVEAIGGKLQS